MLEFGHKPQLQGENKVLNKSSLSLRAARAFCGCWAITLLLVGAPAAPAHDASASLGFFKNYFVTGDYVAAGVGLRGKGVNGLATGTITIDPSQIPAGADIVAAYLYWETLGPSSGPGSAALSGAQFQKNDISGIAVLTNPGGAPACSNGDDEEHDSADADDPSSRAYVYRADVLPYLERITPSDPTQQVRVLAAGAHEVRLPDTGSARRLPSTLGAGLVVVYRVAGYDSTVLPLAYSQPKLPLKSIVIYDGGVTLNRDTPQVVFPMEGFYEASRSAPNAKLTQIVGNGRRGLSDTVQVTSTLAAADNRLVATNPFTGGGNPDSSGTGIDVLTFPLPLEAGAMKAGISVSAGGDSSNCGCLIFGASILSTVVQDRDGDGLLDVWEAQSEWSSKPARLSSVYRQWPLAQPTGDPLPNLQLMGANPDTQDVFVQIDYLVGSDGHSHLPVKPALDAIATAFHNAAPRPALVAAGACSVSAAQGQCPIAIHFDVGAHYQPDATVITPATCAVAATWTPDCAIVPLAAGAKGGSAIPEALCTAAGTLAGSNPPQACAFPGYPGVVGWKNGVRAYRDAPVDVATHSQACAQGQTGCEPRMPRNRKDIFHYALLAHALGYPSLENPLIPVANSGIADSNGGDLMITLGLWDNEVGTPFVQASTLMHELGHNFGLRHGGVLASGMLEANCKPNYQSIMNYLFQVRGLWNAQGMPLIDYSRQQLPALSESALIETSGFGATPAYQARWYSPLASSFVDAALGTTPASRHCDGTPLIATDPAYVARDALPGSGGAIDWNGNGIIAGTQSQDANFDGVAQETFSGADDYATLDLRQIGARRSIGSRTLSYSVVDPATGIAPAPPAPPLGGGFSVDTLITDLGNGVLGYGDLGYGDLGYGDLGYGDLGYGDLGYGDLGYGDLGAPIDGPASKGEPTPTVAVAAGAGKPSALTATASSKGVELTWAAPPVGTVVSYQLYRVTGSTVTPANFQSRVLVATLPGTATQFFDAVGHRSGHQDSDDECRGNGSSTYTYFIVATFTNPSQPGKTLQSGPSNLTTVAAQSCCDDRDRDD